RAAAGRHARRAQRRLWQAVYGGELGDAGAPAGDGEGQRLWAASPRAGVGRHTSGGDGADPGLQHRGTAYRQLEILDGHAVTRRARPTVRRRSLSLHSLSRAIHARKLNTAQMRPTAAPMTTNVPIAINSGP